MSGELNSWILRHVASLERYGGNVDGSLFARCSARQHTVQGAARISTTDKPVACPPLTPRTLSSAHYRYHHEIIFDGGARETPTTTFLSGLVRGDIH